MSASTTLTPPVSTTEGSVVGRIDDDVCAFLGIPYAASCAGARRWRAAGRRCRLDRDARGHRFRTGSDPAAESGSAPAFARHLRGLPNAQRVATGRGRDDDPLPVMVWFEGGSFMTVSGASARIDGAALARRGVVVVTVNYRVNIFGFLAHPLLTAESAHRASGNYGLMDQIAALRWVRANIAAFGGDATRVTVFGVSAGSASISLLLTSPLAAGLFDRAILHSPGAFRPLC